MAAVSAPASELRLPDGFSLHPGRALTASRHWFDTFDRRLLAADTELYIETSGGKGRVVVEADGAAPVTADWAGPPGTAPEVLRPAELPEVVRSRLGGLPGPRALVPLVAGRMRLHEHRVVDAEEKTVCRLVVQTADPIGHRVAQVRAVTTVALRGYEAETELVAAAAGAGEISMVQALLHLVGQADAPGAGAPGRDLRPDLPGSAGLASILGHLFETLQANVPGTLARYDEEFLHDLRVAVRRGRTALKLAQEVVAEEPRVQLATELKWLGDVTTPARDLDVHLSGFPDLEATAVAEELRDDTAPFTALLVARGHEAHRHLGEGLRSPRFRRLVSGAPAALARLADPYLSPAGAPVTTATLGRRRLEETFGRVMRRGRRVDAGSPDDAVHDLRKRAKELRYTIEFFSGLLPAEGATALVKDLKRLQDVLGDFNDTVVQRDLLLECAETLAADGVGARTIVVLGEMRRELALTGDRARAELAGRYAGLRRWRKDGRWDHLLDSLE